ncbi:AAA domain-containing protein [Tistrella mobilis]|uniref:DEAD/DEAH box helicase n=1 Tax=Tistrella mobilis TaxID=171437 RepID=UPI0035564B83
MSSRPYMNKNIAQLEKIFRSVRDDVNNLNVLANELSYRKTNRARELAIKVDKTLAVLVKQGGVAEPAPAVAGRRSDAASTPFSATAPSDAHSLDRPISPRDPEIPAVSDAPVLQPEVVDIPIDLEALPSFSPSGRPDDARAILAAWTALEALSPQSYKRPQDLAAGDRSRVAQLERGAPWGASARSRPNYKLYFEVFLGAIALDRASDDLARAFGEGVERSRPDGKKAAIGSILVNKEGHVLEEKGIAVSSFAWALRVALDRKLDKLGAWPQVERHVVEKLDQMVRRHDEDGKPMPLDLDVVHQVHRWLVHQFGVPAHLVEPPSFALKVFHYYKTKTPPEPSLLNSFYLEDLGQATKVIDTGRAGVGLLRYMGIGQPAEKVDVLSPAAAIEPFVSPSLMPPARWPSPGGHPLVLLQQAAVNIARAELGGAPGILGINGPPGTGKTTLLRDIVVGCIVDRAMAMAAFDRPDEAFETTGQKAAMGPNAFLHFYRLDASLKGHEVVVASSNNKAVENVSRELPLKDANGRHDRMSYFRSISDLIANPGSDFRGEEDISDREPVETWGLMAAVLGNGGNRAAFQRAFWWDEDGGFRTYLKAARGGDVMREIKDQQTGKIVDRVLPPVVALERPSNNDADAAAAWRQARATFLRIKEAVDAEITGIEKMRKDILAARKNSDDLLNLERLYAEMKTTVEQSRQTTELRRRAYEDAAAQVGARTALLDAHNASRPGFLPRVFGVAGKSWRSTEQELSESVRQAVRQQKAAHEALQKAEIGLMQVQTRLQAVEEEILKKRQHVSVLDAAVVQARNHLGGRIVDEQLFKRAHDEIHLTAPWLPDNLHSMREDLFAAALAVHKAFIDASASRLQHNLGLLMSAMSAGFFKSPAHRELLPDLWSTLFMVVPVVSTTFASVRSMFGDLPPESLGWLLIDEAGQALPQAAVGAIMRAKRSIIVGDPLQVPPVVTLPERLASEICKYYDVDEVKWSAPSASAQTLADQASRFRSRFVADVGDREVGLPLLVHRRCQNPMFDISNSIAYARQMVHAAGARRPGPIGTVWGPSRWINVNGHADTKWCPEEGEVVVRMLMQLAASGVSNPDLFIITPFKIIETEMRRRLEREADLLRELGVQKDQWGRERVGTIHTFQGREADTVILLLGAPNATPHGARRWAANPPNIVNVAVTRAKQNLYVIGSANAWAGSGASLQVLQRHLSTR